MPAFIPEAIASRTAFTRKVTPAELYDSLVFALPALFVFAGNRWSQTVPHAFIERVQLAVTAVSACAVCSYVHSRLALEMGLSEEEITRYLTGTIDDPNPAEAKALLFAEHFAETRGRPSADAYAAFAEAYGHRASRILVAAMQLMLAGNLIGLPLSARRARRNGMPYTDSSVAYEWGMVLGFWFMVPVAALHAFLRTLTLRPTLVTA